MDANLKEIWICNELKSLFKYRKGAPYSWLNSQGFTNVQSDLYWSSIAYVGNTSDAWGVNMGDGDVNSDDKSKDNYVWPVRGGR
ncbi:MAG: DUF1566 domain-containing protein [Nitrospirae bacterium]|nr:DUF1566 domain-containing protein [Nitrospirota bacterium]